MEGEIDLNQIITIPKAESVKKYGISFRRVTVWTLIFTNAFFLSYFIARLLK